MKKLISLLLIVAMLCSFTVFATAYKGENYVLFSTTQVNIPANQHVSGDSNGDGKVNILDVITSLKYISGNKNGSRYDSIDTNYDGNVDLVDALTIINYILGYNTTLGKLVG